MKNYQRIKILFAGILSATQAFSVSTRRSSPLSQNLLVAPIVLHRPCQSRRCITRIFQSSDGDGEPKISRRRKRVKRKESKTTGSEEGADNNSLPATTPELKPRENETVRLQVQDVRNLVGSAPSSYSESSESSSKEQSKVAMSPSEEPMRSSTSSSTSKSDIPMDSLEMLLQDAKEMQDAQGGSVRKKDETDGGFSIPGAFRNILSTIVTIDFFVVCAFLLWFLAGIFCSYILKDDTVQIAFNQLFQPVVQPALGILMIGAIAGSFGRDEEKE